MLEQDAGGEGRVAHSLVCSSEFQRGARGLREATGKASLLLHPMPEERGEASRQTLCHDGPLREPAHLQWQHVFAGPRPTT